MSVPALLDLDDETRRALELDAVLTFAASFAASAPGRRLIAGTIPSADRAHLAAEHEAVAEAARHLERWGRFVPGGLPDPSPCLASLSVDALDVEAMPLRDLASVLLEAGALKARLAAIPELECAGLRALSREIPDLTPLARPLAEHIGADGRLEDDASADLRRIRHAIARTGERLRRQLESFLHDPAAATVVRDDFVTQRNGRFVIPVRSDAPRSVAGIVHAASSSGQTLFVEPMESVPLNNDLVRLEEEEAAERLRILRGWADRLRSRLPEVRAAVETLARADSLQARALFGRAIDGVGPALVGEDRLSLREVRHPLLDRRLREAGGRCVPITVALDPSDRVLVISGPNTGGKTVALKSIGLASVMAQCGLPVAAEQVVLPVYRRIRADIGDHQSIEADLSTFSAHVRAVARFVGEADPPALFLLDEIGTGTEPGEGAALAQAILERFLRHRVTVVATTHLGALKTWAFGDPRVESAAMEFDAATLRPSFRVLQGAAGASAGIDVASRLGLDLALVARARELVGPDASRAEASMARLRELTVELAGRAEAAARAEDDLRTRAEALEREAREEAAHREQHAARHLGDALREFREHSRREIAAIEDARERARAERRAVAAESRLATTARRAAARTASKPPAAAVAPFAPAPGLRVRILSLDREGEILSIRGDRVEVRMGRATFTVARGDLGPPDAPVPASPGTPRFAGARPGPAARDRADDLPGPAPELHLIGRTVDEALPELERFLDAAARDERSEVRVVHGHGTGRLRAAVRRHLAKHPLVAAVRAGGASEGGDGATVVTMR